MEDEEEKNKEEVKKEIPKRTFNFKLLNAKNFPKKCKQNPWIASTLVLGIFVLILLFAGNFSGGITGKVISKEEAGEMVLKFVNSQIDGEAELVGINVEGGLYEVMILFEGREVPVYITTDGKNLVQGITPFDSLMQQQEQTQNVPEEYSEEDLDKLRIFSSCLAEKGITIYGANWCGYTKQLVIDVLGGFGVVGNAYVECTENTELCASEGIEGYPTIKLNGEVFTNGRTLEALGEATGCQVPEINTMASTEEASC